MIKFPVVFFFLCFLIVRPTSGFCQNTIGLISYKPEKSFPGYNLLFPHGQSTVWLLNECGEVVHQWEDDRKRVPGNSVYLMDNGDLLVCYNRPGSNTDPIWAGGAGQYVELRSWDNEVLWEFELNDSLRRIHHDVTPMPNGNILMIAWENKTPQEAIENGRDPLLITEGAVWPDFVFEYDPYLDSIVWEWHAWDHLIQDFDNAKLNYGVISEHPELINLNHIYASGQADWMHSNAIDYNPDLDLIMLSVPHFDEIWFIDHSTTQSESSSHSGGYWGRGGDLVYRWGNPRAYHRGDSSDQKLFFTHDCHWIEDFVGEEYPYFGSVALFNNRFGSDYSAANIFTPVADTINRTFEMTGNIWGPAEYDLTILHPVDPTLMYSSGLSSFQVLPNGNYLILNGRNGNAYELTPDNEIVWEYIVPIKNGAFISQGELASNNLTFRMKRYPLDFTGFNNKELTPDGYLELNPDTSFCNLLISSTDEYEDAKQLSIYPNPSTGYLIIEGPAGLPFDYTITDILGKAVMKGGIQSDIQSINVSALKEGIYVLHIEGYRPQKIIISK